MIAATVNIPRSTLSRHGSRGHDQLAGLQAAVSHAFFLAQGVSCNTTGSLG